MSYSLVGISAVLICLIINKDILFTKNELSKAYKIYRWFLISLIIFFISDALWGLLDQYHLMTILYIDTLLFFFSMLSSVVFWTFFVSVYVNKSKRTNIALLIGGTIIFLFLIVVTIIDFFEPILFKFDGYDYIPLYGRFILYTLQIALFVIVGAVTLTLFVIEKTNVNRYRYLSIGLFSLLMSLSIVAQLIFPLLPFYSAGCIVSNCMIHIFVVGSEKDEVLKKLRESLKREQITGKELDLTKTLVYVDSLTGAKSKHAFVEVESRIDEMIANKNINPFSIVVFDINGLKYINDTKGHESGDIYIKDCYNIIKDVYQNTEVYRFGGDEFVGILDGEDYLNRDVLINKFNDIIDVNLSNGNPVVSVGMSDFDELNDNTFNKVFVRADEKMYIRKKYLKSHGSSTR